MHWRPMQPHAKAPNKHAHTARDSRQGFAAASHGQTYASKIQDRLKLLSLKPVPRLAHSKLQVSVGFSYSETPGWAASQSSNEGSWLIVCTV